MNTADRLTSPIEIYTASWVAGFVVARAGLDWRTSCFSHVDAGLGFRDGALAYEKSLLSRANAPLGPAH